MFKLDKRGAWFFEETAKIIFSVIIIVFIVWFTVSLLLILKSDTELEQAEATLKEIERVVSKMEPGDVETVLIEGPKDWEFKRSSSNDKILCIFNSTDKEGTETCFDYDYEISVNTEYNDYFCMEEFLEKEENVILAEPLAPKNCDLLEDELGYYVQASENTPTKINSVPLTLYLEIYNSKLHLSFEGTRAYWESLKGTNDLRRISPDTKTPTQFA